MEHKLFILSAMSLKQHECPIQASDLALQYIRKKLDFYGKRNRVPKILLAERSCQGAVFRFFFSPAAEDETKVSVQGIDLYLDPALLEEYDGFNLDLEVFFFARRLMISPRKQSYQCDCKQKCDKAVQ